MKRILFVCLGNICRSPAAEAVFAARAAVAGLRVMVDSAGTGDWHIGDPPYPPMIRAAAARGYDLSALRARQVAAADFDAFDLILAMDRKNLTALDRLRPTGSLTPVRLFLDGIEGMAQNEVPDPYYTRDFAESLDLIEAATDALIERISRVG
ncbi:Low molecular weight protein-tyrosine-phosphatase YfkJ [Defluviimonas aquaemixtae]|uniref:protein-tyrosine-phosphatase n=1 Tax=Albidovulum aquaemixtae TaxID=1542388 RepID=A0A2R8B7K6_9RHOB|nr:low molecular weight protein-tyrosine-phosphatase [Defluviimonas aquaemixtae]SPH18621.1 Low molecular weight protein-tyrosine-phosphatase YfkJ [Defluviimonas aquaemixtae]